MRLLIAFMLLAFTSNVFAAGEESRIYAQRVNTSGAKIGSAIEINSGTTGQPQSEPAVAFFDDRFLVVYQEWNGSDMDVKAVRLAMDGTVLDTTPLIIASGVKTQSLPDVAADTTGWMVVWQGWEAGSLFPRLFARRVPQTGTSLGTPLEFGDSEGLGTYPKIAYNATTDTFGVLHTGSNHDRVTDKYTTITVLSTTPTVEYPPTDKTYEERHSPIFHDISDNPDGGWTFNLSGNIATIYITRLAQAAITVDADGSYSAGNYMDDDERLYTQWGTDSTVFMDNSTGNTAGVSQHAYGFNAITNDSAYAIAAWERWTLDPNFNKRYSDCSIYGGRLDGSDLIESVGGTLIVGEDSGVRYEKPALAGNGSGTVLVTYDKTTNGEMEIGSKLLTGAGSGISPGSEVILRDTTNGTRRTDSNVAYGDDSTTQEFMVVWTEGWWGTL